MGVPLPGSNNSVAPATKANPGATPATGQLSSTDQANVGWTGTLSAVGPDRCYALYGAFNISIYPSVTLTLTTTSGSTSATLNSGTGTANGQTIVGVNIPPGTTIASGGGTTNIVLALPPGYTSANIVSGADAAAKFYGPSTGATATIVLERSFDGGVTWMAVSSSNAGAPLSWQFAAAANLTDAISVTVSEQEKGVLYRLNTRAYTSGTFNYRISATGTFATSMSFPGP